MMLNKPSSLADDPPPIPSFRSSTAENIPVDGMGSDLILVWTSFTGAHLLRHGGIPASLSLPRFALLLLLIGLLKLTIFREFRLYQGLWKHAGTPEAVRLIHASSLASGCVLIGFLLLPQTGAAPISVLILDWMLTIVTTAGRRFGHRAFTWYWSPEASATTRVLIYGADDYGILLLRYLRHSAAAPYAVAGFLDPNHDGLRLQGLPIVDTPEDTEAEGLVVPIPPVPSEDERSPAQIFARYAPEGFSCFQFQLAMSASKHSPSEELRCSPPSQTG